MTPRPSRKAVCGDLLRAPTQHFPAPDCGSATFADNPISSAEVAEHQLKAIAAATRRLRSSWDSMRDLHIVFGSVSEPRHKFLGTTKGTCGRTQYFRERGKTCRTLVLESRTAGLGIEMTGRAGQRRE